MSRRKIEMHHYRQALMRMRQGDSDRDVARSGLMGRRTAAALRTLAVEQGWLDPQRPLPDDATIADALAAPKRAKSTISGLEPLRGQIAAWHAQGVSAVVILAALKREHGHTGSYSAVRRMLATLKRETPPEATIRLDFAPGEAAQVDFGAGPLLADTAGVVRRTWAFVMTLCFSRHQYVEFVWDQTVATWLGCHRRAFEWFCGVPARVIIDNAKCAIIKACQNDPEVQRSYADCAEGYGFKIDPCPPHDPQKKGIVESGVKYVKGNFLPLKTFRDLVDLNAQARLWVLEEAGLRRHGTTGEAPLSRFEVERAVLSPLPAIAPDLGVWKQASVHRDGHLQFDRAFYSVPWTLVGKSLWLKASDGMVTVYDDFRPVAAHGRARRPGERRTVRDHLPPDAQAFLAHDRDWCLRRAAVIGPTCAELIERLLADRIVERLRAAQNVLRLAKSYPAARLEAACALALAHDSPFYRTVKTILAGGHDLQAPAVMASSVPHSGRFARDAASLFAAPVTVQ
ncbi:MAG: IS21 family transposase [Candidatus Accumulibacter sp.]|uniref:IS21 family transposase n=2 Tax=Accumulibacter sp. TaxID=2053492 RepID=UPI00260100F0|nr:IS21 family transposase [Accumulibacter sp.]MCM8594250.1 IS21 family transposase [Accumulibacter sp.]MDS4048394.1 IS21 family transposase [Accumulibacter sp.]